MVILLLERHDVKKHRCVYCNMPGKNGSGIFFFFFFFFSSSFQPKQLKCTYWLSLCFTNINFVFIKENNYFLLTFIGFLAI